MGFGSTAKKLQTLADTAETLYQQLSDVRERMADLEATAQTTSERVEALETEVQQQRALLEAIATEHDIDPQQIGATTTDDTTDAPTDQ